MDARYKIQDSRSEGFTMIEIVIMLAILTFVSGILLTSVPGFNEDAALIRAQQELALNFRRAQNIAFSVAEVTLPDGSHVAPSRIGLHFDVATPTEYFFFIDGDNNSRYKDPPDPCPPGVESCTDQKIDPAFTFQHGVRFNPAGAFYNQSGGTETKVNVVFSAPEARAVIYNDEGSIGGTACFELKTLNLDLTRGVRVRTSGQVGIEKSCS